MGFGFILLRQSFSQVSIMVKGLTRSCLPNMCSRTQSERYCHAYYHKGIHSQIRLATKVCLFIFLFFDSEFHGVYLNINTLRSPPITKH